jgi:hypothetical protein
MAYEREIKYNSLDTEKLILNPDLKISSCAPLHSQGEPSYVLDSPLLRISKGCSIEPTRDTSCKLRNADNYVAGMITFDCQDEGSVERLRCIAIAWQDSSNVNIPDSTRRDETPPSGDLYHVLVVTGKPPRRLGVAVISGKCLSPFQESEDEILEPAVTEVDENPVESHSKIRLLNASTFTLQEFSDGDIPDYAILSHRWENEGEVTF